MKRNTARRPIALATFAALAMMTTATAAGSTTGKASNSSGYLLALGDSLAAGYQPFDSHQLPPTDASTGFPDQGYPDSYAQDVASERGLRLADLGCPGETSQSFSHSPAMNACADLYQAEFGAHSQLAAARVFLSREKNKVKLVTFDLGANDIDPCISSGAVNYSCLRASDARALSAIGKLLTSVRSQLAVDDPGATVAALNYYDPFLGRAYTPGGTRGRTEATGSLAGVKLFDAQLAAVFRADHVVGVDVASAFDVDDLLPLERFRGERLPKDVVVACTLTWMCPSTGGHPDIHPNDGGYAVIATAIEKVVATS